MEGALHHFTYPTVLEIKRVLDATSTREFSVPLVSTTRRDDVSGTPATAIPSRRA